MPASGWKPIHCERMKVYVCVCACLIIIQFLLQRKQLSFVLYLSRERNERHLRSSWRFILGAKCEKFSNGWKMGLVWLTRWTKNRRKHSTIFAKQKRATTWNNIKNKTTRSKLLIWSIIYDLSEPMQNHASSEFLRVSMEIRFKRSSSNLLEKSRS